MTPTERRALCVAMLRLKRGDRSAFDAVYDGLFPVALAFARRMVGESDAEDVTQQALLKLFAQASAYDETKDVAAWALSLTAWECRTVRTRIRRRREVPLEAELETSSYDPRDALLEQKILSEARAVLRTLSPDDQATLQSAFADQGRGATFRKRKQRAMQRLLSAWRFIHG